MRYYEFAEILLGTTEENTDYFDAYCRHDLDNTERKCDLIHKSHSTKYIPDKSSLIFSSETVDGFLENGKMYIGYKSHRPAAGSPYTHMNCVSDDFSKVDTYRAGSYARAFSLYGLMYEFSACVLKHGGMMFHAAAVEYKNEAVLFTAPSGIGKSTHARYWKKEFNALVINGDTPVVREHGGISHVYGVPWCGSSGENVDRHAPLKAVVMLKRGDENKINEISLDDSALELYSQVVYPYWMGDLRIDALDAIKKMFDNVKIYELECIKAPSAAEVARAAIYG